MNAVFDILFMPLTALSPLQGLTLVSILMGIILVLIYGKISNQGKLRQVKRGIWGALLESILFRRDLKISLAAQAKMLKGAFSYFLLAIPPLLILIIPCLVVLAQLNAYLGLQPLRVHSPALLSIELRDELPLKEISIQGPAEVEIAGPVRVASEKSATFRLQAAAPGDFSLHIAPLKSEIPIHFGSGIARLSPVTSESFWDKVLYPSSLELPSQVTRVSVSYPEREFKVAGITVNWVIYFFLVSLVAGLLAAKVFHVEV